MRGRKSRRIGIELPAREPRSCHVDACRLEEALSMVPTKERRPRRICLVGPGDGHGGARIRRGVVGDGCRT